MSRALDVWFGVTLGATSTWAVTTYMSFSLIDAAFSIAFFSMIGSTLAVLTSGDPR